MLEFCNIYNSNIIHIKYNNKTCKNIYISKLFNIHNLKLFNNKILCKNCATLFLDKIKIYNLYYYIYNNIIYYNIFYNIILGSINNNGNILFNNINLNLISINKNKYYLINNIDLYIYNINILNINNYKKIGKLLGPQMCIINKNMIIINKLKYNLWEK